MTLWLVYSPLRAEQEAFAQAEAVLPLAWEVGDLSATFSPQERTRLLRENFPDEPPEVLAHARAQLEWFLNGILKEDIVILPLFHRGVALCGEVTGGYEYRPDAPVPHIRPVRWIGEPQLLAALEKLLPLPLQTASRIYPIQDAELAEALQRRFALPFKPRRRWQVAIMLFLALSQLLLLAGQWLKGEGP